jgi:RNA polymerase-binding transcription factor DksA
MRHIDDITHVLRDQLDRYRDCCSGNGAYDPWRDVVLVAQAAAGDFDAEDEHAMTTRNQLWVTARNHTGAALLVCNVQARWEIYSKTYPHCQACGCRIPLADLNVTPETDNDPRWYALAVSHGVRCSWILTRAGRRLRLDPAQLAAELKVTLKLLYHSHTGVSGADGTLADHLRAPISDGHSLTDGEVHPGAAGQHGIHDGLHGRTWATSPTVGAPRP